MRRRSASEDAQFQWYQPGIVFDRGAAKDPLRAPISMMGKVACRADASHGAIALAIC